MDSAVRVLAPSEAALVTKDLVAVRSYDTMTSGYIRAYENAPGVAPPALLVEEVDIESKKTVLRVLPSLDVVDAFIAYRKEDYAMLWGSCCYAIDYTAPFPPPSSSSNNSNKAVCTL